MWRPTTKPIYRYIPLHAVLKYIVTYKGLNMFKIDKYSVGHINISKTCVTHNVCDSFVSSSNWIDNVIAFLHATIH